MPLLKMTKQWRDDAESAARDARRMIAGEPRGPGWGGGLLMALASAAAGALTLYLLDPDRGRSRRARLADQAAATLRRAGRETERFGRIVESTVAGKIEAMKHEGNRVGPTDDVTLTARAESELFRDSMIPKGSINLNVERGILVLRGEVPTDQLRRQLEEQAARIDGVWSVRNLLHLPDEPAPAEELVGASR
jgi:osmotically-inducible protein OsmY